MSKCQIALDDAKTASRYAEKAKRIYPQEAQGHHSEVVDSKWVDNDICDECNNNHRQNLDVKWRYGPGYNQ